MIPDPTRHWDEMLAAYADGEFEGRDDLALLKQRIEDWLAKHPEAQAELAEYRRLKQLWQDSTPAEPSVECWRRLLAQIKVRSRQPYVHKARWRNRAAAAGLAACIALAIWAWSRIPTDPPVTPAPPVIAAEFEVFPVAALHEIEILSVEGADTSTVVVGAMPVHGMLELAAPGEVSVTSVQPADRDNMMPMVRVTGPGRPMIWARLDSE